MFYVYVWRDENLTPFYVGKGKGDRAYDLYGRSSEFMDVYSRGGCGVEIVDWFIHESQAYAHEMRLISLYGRRECGGTLVNKTDGGEGLSNCSDKTRSKMSASARLLWLDAGRRMEARDRQIRRFEDISEREEYSRRTTLQWKDAETRQRMVISQRKCGPTSGFKGTSRDNRTGRWRSQIFINGKRVSLGAYAREEDAAKAYDRAAFSEFGDNCYLNFGSPHIAANDNARQHEAA